MGNENDAENSAQNEPSIADVMSKLDSFEQRIAALEPQASPEPAPASDPKLDSACAVLRELLADSYPKEKLDAWDLEHLTMAAEIRKDLIIPDKSAGNPAPKGKTDNASDVIGKFAVKVK